ncbi:uveal autoantigen with coiled-coil domains and ankyrin repeats [Cottoperca gobio]|uniref:Uveal autoantigen with coiled-coil domains and ankyrin repeats n=1 Tax=Cottoperca gobio TaxID=56716 RepID=A0A6J2P7H2_COTGO|nr:uveal autoantigen with coiled-coil domains and ankyrin repeats-like [Cottoperca gobio]
MKSLKYRLKKHEVTITNTDWNKYDDRLMKAVERSEVDKVAAVLSKKGIIPTKLDVEGRSAFHLAATRGHLECLNLILGHSVDVTATDATGKNALHLASRNGHSLCVQKLLQHNSPVGNVDLQGRTALHDAVMAGCSSSVKLLCDSGASVNASDFDGRTPLVLATQMCHPRICQLLLERGADITTRDKQNKTALILGCEYGCKDAVEVLLKSGSDVKAVDGLGHDAFHYARLNKNLELVAMVKTYLDKATREQLPAEKFDNMKNLLSNAVDEKERQIAELREDYDRVLEEVADLHQKLDSPSSQGGSGAMSAEEQQRILEALEGQNASLKRKLVDVTARSQALIQDVEESEEERDILREQLDELNSTIEIDFIPMKVHDEARGNMVTALEELEDKLVEASERYGKAEAQVQQLQSERPTLQENISSLQSASERRLSEMDALRSQNGDLMKKIEVLQSRCEDRAKECVQLTTQSQTLKQSLEGEYVPRQEHEQVKMELSSTLESVKAEMLKLETKGKESAEELKKMKEGNDKLKEKLEKVLLEMKKDYMSVKDHKAIADELNAAVVEAENRAKEVSGMYVSAQEETVKLTQELEAQKKELDTIQEAIQSKFIPLTAAEEKEHSHSAKVKELTVKLLEMEEKYNKEKSAGESNKQEKEKLKVEIESVQQRLDSAVVASEKHKNVEEEFKGKFEELTQKLVNLEQSHKEVTLQKTDLQGQNALSNAQFQNLQERLKSELTRIATYDTELKALHDAMQQAQADCKKAKETQQEEALRVCALQKEVQERRGDQASLLQQQAKAQDALEAEVAKLRLALREEEENNAQRAEDVSALQSELLQATQALEENRYKEDQMNQLKKEKQQLEEEAATLSSKLLSLAEESEEAHREATQAQVEESTARTEMEAVQEKGCVIEREIRELKERYDESLRTICDLQRRIQTSAQQTEAKDRKITELLTDVERLKQALNGLSQLAYTSNTPNKRQTQHIDTLHVQIKNLQQQLADAERQHREVVSIYRTHLLSAAQGHMDEDVQAALLQIIRMRQEFVC